jgi:poly(A) polymerase
VATFRAEGEYEDGRHPGRVTFADARADALRRDFTVNGLFYDPVREQLHDWVGGEPDLRHRLIRTIGAPADRFAEDHLRLLRAVRFAKQLDFAIDPATFAALRPLAPKLKLISAERIRDELVKLFSPPRAERGLELLHHAGLLEVVLPEVAATVTCEQSPDYHPEGTVFNHLLAMLVKLPADAPPALPWAVLLHDIAKPVTAARQADGSIRFYEHEAIGARMAEEILERLRFPRRQIDEVVAAVRHHMQYLGVSLMRKSTLRRMILRPTFPLELELHRLDCLGSNGKMETYEFMERQAREVAEAPSLVPPLLTGHDLAELGMKPGKGMGQLLREARDKQLQDELKTPAEARDWARARLAKEE